jgi:hypothetical protein
VAAAAGAPGGHPGDIRGPDQDRKGPGRGTSPAQIWWFFVTKNEKWWFFTRKTGKNAGNMAKMMVFFTKKWCFK